MAYYDFLNMVFAPILKLPPLVGIILMSFLVSIIIILITKYASNQKEMKRLKDEMKEYQAKVKEAKGNPQKAMDIQKKAMEVNMQYMMHSFKPTLITFIPIIFIFGWMSSVFAFDSIQPQEQFSITASFIENAKGQAEIMVPKNINVLDSKKQAVENNQVTWNLKGAEGDHKISVEYNGEKQEKVIIITNEKEYAPQKQDYKNSAIKSIQINYKKNTVLPIGYKDWFGWLGTYIIFSIIFTMVLRKFMKVY